jgi:hypothetical protein
MVSVVKEVLQEQELLVVIPLVLVVIMVKIKVVIPGTLTPFTVVTLEVVVAVQALPTEVVMVVSVLCVLCGEILYFPVVIRQQILRIM